MDHPLKDHPLYPEARRHVKELRGFYGHALSYVVVIGGLVLLNAFASPGRWWVQWAAFGWGLGLAAHGLSMLTRGSAFGRAWEERKIREYLERAGSR
ncbi:MAG: 2TM domain-containing protein [Burkholderiales bacterium]|nr:2TM domain-containing protein [Burkholderiales bacterium]